MILNVVSPHFGTLATVIFSGCLRCLDRGCTCDKRKTKKLLQEDYEGVYIGPDFIMEIRYSQIISNIYITLLYSSGMPILYPILVIIVFLTYWIDKYLCNYKHPIMAYSFEDLQETTKIRHVLGSNHKGHPPVRNSSSFCFWILHALQFQHLLHWQPALPLAGHTSRVAWVFSLNNSFKRLHFSEQSFLNPLHSLSDWLYSFHHSFPRFLLLQFLPQQDLLLLLLQPKVPEAAGSQPVQFRYLQGNPLLRLEVRVL